ncbi:MAG: FHA domain-containing protein [Myxococcota bacterium]|nr:FHA domain-containing protein [Myxococcota bacterium]
MNTRSTARKILQSFHARTTLWRLFEIRAQEMECTVDYLINESMRLYATTHGFLDSDEPPQPRHGSYTGEMPTVGPMRPNVAPPSVPVSRTAPPVPPPRRDRTGSSVQPPPAVPPPRPPTGREFTGPQPPARPSHMPALTMIYQGAKVPIHSQQFIIGRGSKASDLAIKDANVSRKHAAVIYHNGAFYIKDLGSTNGIEFNGQQVDSKRIDEGDVFSLCGHELHFTYQV